MKNNLIILYATILQLTTALVLLFSPIPIVISRLGIFYQLFPNFKLGASIMLLSVLLSIFADIKIRNRMMYIFLNLPQQFFLILNAASAINYIVISRYADGVLRPRDFMFLDQLPSILAAGLYLIALFQFTYRNHEFT